MAVTERLTAEEVLAAHQRMMQEAADHANTIRDRMAALGLYHEVIMIMKWSIDQDPYDPYRYGQALFNVLSERHSDIAERVRGQDFDPFYNDNKIDACLTWLEKNTELGKS